MADAREHAAPHDEPSSGRYRHLPEPIRVEDTISTKQAAPPPDPEAGRNPDRDFLLRYAAL